MTEPLAKTFQTLWVTLVTQVDERADPSATLRPSLGEEVVWSGGMERPAPSAVGALRSLGETLGEGGMGVVRLAEQVSVGRKVASKAVRGDPPDPRATARLLQEAWVSGLLEHPSIVPIYDIALDEAGQPHILMKRIVGQPWSALLRDPALAEQVLGTQDLLDAHLRVLQQVCNALQYAHERGIIHRDVKPDNVMIGGYGEVYLLDWGLALAVDGRYPAYVPRASEERRLAGTPRYMAPEMIVADGRRLGVHTDVYLLGAVLFELLTEAAPHQGESLERLLVSIPDFIPVFPEDAPEPLCELVREATDLDPVARPPSAAAFRARVQAFLELRPALRLLAEAQEQVRRLERAIEADEGRPRVHARLSAARFGYRQALAIWPDHPTAAAELEAALLRVTRWELDRDEPASALALLGDILNPPADLIAAVEARAAAKAGERRQLERLERDRSVEVGVRTRAFVGGSLLVVWFLKPVWGMLSTMQTSWLSLTSGSVGMVLLVIGLGVWARDSLSKSALNRATFGALLAVPLSHSVTDLATWAGGGTPDEAYSARAVAWTVTAIGYTAMVDWRLFPTCVAFGVAALLAHLWPAATETLFLVANGALILNATGLWAGPLIQDLRERPLRGR